MIKRVLRPFILAIYYIIIIFCILDFSYFDGLDSLKQKIVLLLIIVSGEFVIMIYSLADSQIRFLIIKLTWENTKESKHDNKVLDKTSYIGQLEYLLKNDNFITTKQNITIKSIKSTTESLVSDKIKYSDITHLN